VWDPVGPRGTGRFYSETSEEATAALDEAIARVWACDVEASGVVVDAERSRTAAAILGEASAWGADVIVLTQAIPRIMNVGFWDRVSRQITRGALCPVLLVYQR
jgi:nucleotide-binding universal stress UspA family protein